MKRIRFNTLWPSMWFAWALVTIGCALTIHGSGYSDRWNYFPYALFNLFTPILMANWSNATVCLLIVGLCLGGIIGKRIRIRAYRVAYNLLILFLLTVGTDMIKWQRAVSLDNFETACQCTFRAPKPPWCVVTPPAR